MARKFKTKFATDQVKAKYKKMVALEKQIEKMKDQCESELTKVQRYLWSEQSLSLQQREMNRLNAYEDALLNVVRF